MSAEPSAAAAAAPEIDRRRLAELTARQRELFAARTPRSGETYERARKVMPKGVPSSFQENDPWPVYVDRGTGAQVWDVDGNEYIDFHNGFGVMCVGHANPQIAAAVKRQVEHGTHFAAPTGHSIAVAEELRRRFGLPAVALHELRHRVDHGCGPRRAGRDRPRHDPQDRGLLPRPPRRRDGLRVPAARGARRPRRPDQRPVRRRLSARDHRADPLGAVQRRAGAGAGARPARGTGRGADHGAGDDEHQHRPAAWRATSRRCAG